MPGDTYHITASDDAFVNVGDSYQSGENKRATLFNCLLPNLQSNKSLALYWDHEQARQKHVGTTGEWLHNSDELQSWIREPNSFVWLHGIAGCGKTVLSSTIVDHLRDSLTGSYYTACYYFNAREDEKRNVSRLLRSLLLQLCPTEQNWPPKVEELYNKCLSQELSDDYLFQGLEDLIERDGQTYIVIDALDECDSSFRSGEKSEVEKLAELFLRLTKTKTSNLHLLVTSRDGGLATHVEQALSEIVQKCTEKGICQHTISLETGKMKGKIDSDIREFIEFELRRWNDRKGRLWLPLSEKREELVANAVRERANGMFRLAACLLDLLWRKGTWDELKSALNHLPPELPEVYHRIFKDIKMQGQMETASILLRWLLYSERPLSLEELTEVTMSDLHGASFNPERGTEDVNYVSLTLSSFVTISRDNLVHFAHQTVRDYLLLETTEEGFFTGTENCQEFATKCCLSYMQFCGQSGLKGRSAHDTVAPCPKEYKLLEYVVNNWYRHALKAWRDTTTTNILHETGHSTNGATSQEGPTQWCTLSADDSLISIDGNVEFENAPQPLLEWAASVKLWLNLAAHMESDLYRDALRLIACKGYEKVMGLLLPTEAPITYPHEDSYLSILTAALAGRYREMILLMLGGDTAREQNESPWWPQKPDLTAEMHIITYKSHEAIVRLVVEQATDINMKDSNGWTALHTAAFQGHETIVRLLLGKGVDIQVKDSNGQTPLHIAASQGHEIITRMLLDEGADVNAKDRIGWIALDLAVQKATMEFLPQRTRGDTEYSGSRIAPQAVHNNHETVARTIRSLLEREPGVEENCDELCVPMDEETPNSMTTFQFQDVDIGRGNMKIVALLAKDIVVHGGNSTFIVSVVRSLTLYGGSVNFAMSLVEELLVYGRFPSFARLLPAGTLRLYRWSINFATTNFKNVVIYEGAANFSTSCIRSLVVYGGSAIFSSAAHIRDIVVYGGSLAFLTKVQIESMAVYGGSAIFSSTARIRSVVLHGGSTNFSSTSQIENVSVYGGTANFATLETILLVLHGGTSNFWTAAEIENVVIYGGTVNFTYQIQREMMELLMRKELDILRGHDYKSDTVQIRQLVMHDGSFNIWSDGSIGAISSYGGVATFEIGSTALTLAARCGHELLARLLLENGADPNAKSWPGSKHLRVGGSWLDGSGRTALHEAAYQGHETIVHLLLEKKADLYIEDNNGETALQLAASQGHTAIVRLLEGKELDIGREDEMGRKGQIMLQKAVDRVYSTLFSLF